MIKIGMIKKNAKKQWFTVFSVRIKLPYSCNEIW